MTDQRIAYVAMSTQALSEYARLTKETSKKRAAAIASLMKDGMTITQIAEQSGVTRQSLYKASKASAEKPPKNQAEDTQGSGQ